MRFLVTGSAGHLGEGLMRVLRARGAEAAGLDILPAPYTSHVGSITDPAAVAEAMAGAEVVLHAATLHKPHVATHSRQDFVDVNITGTLTLLEQAARQAVRAFVFTSTTSAFGSALNPPPGAPAVWIDEDVAPVPKNIYGVTKVAAESVCELFHRLHGLPVLILRTSRFFPEEDDNAATRAAFDQTNAKVNELLNRRVDLADAVEAHLLAAERAREIEFARYIVSAPSPFTRADLEDLTRDPAAAVRRHVAFEDEYARRGWRMFDRLDRVYDSARAQADLGWRPAYDFASVLARLSAGKPPFSPLAGEVGAKGYHAENFAEGPYPVA